MRRAREATPQHKTHPHVRWLALRIGAPTPGARTLVLAPSAEAAAALRAATLAERGVLLGVRFVTALPFLREVLWMCGEPTADDLLLPLEERAILREVLRVQDDDVAGYALRHRASLAALHATCREWTRAGRPEPTQGLPAWPTATLRIARAFAAALDAHVRPSRTQLAARARACFARGTRPGGTLRVLSFATGVDSDVAGVLEALRAAGVDVEHAPDPEQRPAAFARSSHPHLDAELRAAAHRCALAFAAGTPLCAMVVAAPRLGPYVPYLAAAFAAEGLPVCAQAETPLAHEPRGALATHAVRLLFDGAPARAWLALLGAPLARAPLPPEQHADLERAAREHGLCGVDALVARVALHLDERAPDAAAAVRRLGERVRAAAAATTPAEKVASLCELLDAELEPPVAGSRDADASARFAELCAELCAADEAAFVQDALELLGSRGLPIGARGVAAVHVVEFAAATAFPAQHVELLGFADDQLPAAVGPTTFCDEGARDVLGLGARAQQHAAERETLTRLTRLPAWSLHVSRAAADAQGRPVGPSPLLDGLAAGELPPAQELVESSHPAARAAARVASGVAASDFAIAQVGLQQATLAATSRLLGARAGLVRKRAQALEDFAGSLAHDGDIGADLARGHLDATLSVSDLQTLARCALQHLFRRVLRLRPLPPEPDALALAPNALGTVVHELLAELGERLPAASAASEPVDVEALSRELTPQLDARLGARAPLAHTLPALHRILVRQWARAIAVGFADDARDLRTRAITPRYHEKELVGELDLGLDQPLRVRGVADRIDTMHDGSLRVIDYKTGGNPGVALSSYDIVRGRQLQMPVYALLTEQVLDARAGELGIRAVRPDWHDPAQLWLRWDRADDFLGGRLREDLRDTLRLLATLRARGTFVPSLDRENACRFCDYRAACHRLHPPSRERITSSTRGEVVAYLDLRRKKPGTRRGGDDAS